MGNPEALNLALFEECWLRVWRLYTVQAAVGVSGLGVQVKLMGIG